MLDKIESKRNFKLGVLVNDNTRLNKTIIFWDCRIFSLRLITLYSLVSLRIISTHNVILSSWLIRSRFG